MRRSNRILLGVCARLADAVGIDPILVRVGFVLGFFFLGIGLFAYLGLWLLLALLDWFAAR